MRISSTKKCILGVIRNSKNYFLIAFEIFRFIKIAKKLTVKILQNLLSLSIEVKRNSMKILNSLNRQMHSCKFQCIGHTEIEIENLGIVKFLNQDFCKRVHLQVLDTIWKDFSALLSDFLF